MSRAAATLRAVASPDPSPAAPVVRLEDLLEKVARGDEAAASAILLAQVRCETPAMVRTRKSQIGKTAAEDRLPDDLYDYARPSARRVGRPAPEDTTTWTVTDDWPDEVPITEAELDVFEAWFDDLFDELFSIRH